MWITCTVTAPFRVADAQPSGSRSAGTRRSEADIDTAGRPASATGVRTVLIRADGATPLGAIATALMALLPAAVGPRRHPPGPGPRHPPGRSHGRDSPPSMHIDGIAVAPELRLDTSPLRDGAQVRLGSPPGATRRERTGLVELRVTGGPGAGMVRRLSPGEYGVGTDPLGGIVLPDRTVPRRAVTLRIDADGSGSVTPAAGADVWIDGCHRPGSVAFAARGPEGTPVNVALRAGATALVFTTPDRPDAMLRPSPRAWGLEISREPRLARWPGDVRYSLPVLPAARPAPPLPVLAAFLPAAAAGGMALAFQAAHLLLFAALAPLSLLGSYLAGRRASRREYRRELAGYQRARAEIDREMTAALDREAAARRTNHPDPAAVLLRAVGPRRGLWERRPHDPDFLHLRVGTGDVPSGVSLTDPAAPDHRRTTRWLLRDAPVTVALPEVGVLGVAGPYGFAQAIGSWLITQAAALHSPRDLSIHLIVTPGSARGWEWARWLPHCRPPEGPPGAVQIGADEPGRAGRAEELAGLTETRLRGSGPGASGQDRPGPAVLVVVEGAASLRASLLPVLLSGPRVGVHVICVERDPRLLPPECQAVVEPAGSGARIRQQGREDVDRIRPDLVGIPATAGGASPAETISPTGTVAAQSVAGGTAAAAARWCETLARGLAPLRDAGPRAAGGGLPTDIRLLDLLGVDPPSSRALAPRWVIHGATTTFPLGAGAAGTVSVDLSSDGPHVLVAGTTGAGKSELLQSMVAALAVRNRPDEMTFVLVDYKGGSAFGDCARLPHTVGLVTDLDPHLVERALDSLGAELRRRESLFAAAGAKDIDDYHRRHLAPPGLGRTSRDDPTEPRPLPRLVVVVDEFAALARELPAFVTGLVGLAGRGRSLGIHLVLATQRPAGVVSPEILANTNLRIALRVTDQAESSDVLGLPDAAFLPVATPGRAILRVGQNAPQVFQTARVGGLPPRARERSGSAPLGPLVVDLPWPPPQDEVLRAVTALAHAATGAAAQLPPVTGTPAADEPTDLRRLADALRETARACRITDPRRPWLPPLPERMRIDALPPVDTPLTRLTPRGLAPVPLGLADLCRAQSQPTFAVDLEHGSHLLIVGGPRSGRSTVLRTLAGSVARTASPADVHLYCLDCGNNSLSPVAGLPHTGAVVAGSETERVHRLLARLAEEVSRRQALLARGGFADLAEARAARSAQGAALPPYLLLLLDGYEGFLASFEDLEGMVAVDRLLALARDGLAVGLRIMMTADRRALTGHLAATIEQRLVLRMAERADYSLAGLAGTRIPEALPPGRGFLTGGAGRGLGPSWDGADGPVEVQLALLDDDPSGAAQAAALRQLATRCHPSASRSGTAAGQHPPPGPRPFRVDVLPARVSRHDLAALTGIADIDALGVPGSPDLPGAAQRSNDRLPVTLGAGGNDLASVSVDLVADGPGFVIAGPARSGRSSALIAVARGLHAHGHRMMIVSPRPSPLRACAAETGAEIIEEVSGGGPQRLAHLLRPGVRIALLVDDVELLAAAPLGEDLAAFWRDTHGSGNLLVVAGTTDDLVNQFRGLVADARRSRCGLLLSPAGPADGDLFGVRLPRALCAGPDPPGRGLLLRRGGILPIQVIDPQP